MKHIFSVFSILCSTHIIFTMEFDKEEGIPLETIYRRQEQMISGKPNSKSLEEQFNDFEKGLREKYGGGGGLLQRLTRIPLFAPDHIKICEEHLPVILATEELIEKFSQKKGSYFNKTITLFISKVGAWNLHGVTCDTLADIQNPNAQQHREELNALPLVLKKYVMDRAYKNLCNINPIDDSFLYDLHPDAGLMVTVSKSSKGGILQLWNLKTQEMFHNFPEMGYPRKIQFSNDGSCLVAATDCQQHSDATNINIWEVSSGSPLNNTGVCEIYPIKLLHTINRPGSITSLDLCCRWGKSEKLLTIISNNSVELYSCREDNEKCIILSHIPLPVLEPDFHNAHIAHCEQNEDTGIFKNNYRSFYLCKLALSNTKNASSLPKIKDAPAYKVLTKYEKEKIDTQFKRRVAQLAAINQ